MDILTDAAIQAIIQQGVWCILFIILFVFTMKRNSIREAKYETILNEQSKALTEQSKSLADITHTLNTINNKIDNLNKEVGELENGNRQ